MALLIKANPGKYDFASIGNGSLSQLAMEAIAIKAGTKLAACPLHEFAGRNPRGDPRRRADGLPAGDLGRSRRPKPARSKCWRSPPPKRSPYLPDVPTLKESGIDVEADAWNGLIAPGGTPKPIIDTINKDVVAIIKSPAVRDKLAAQLMEPVGSTPEEFRALIDGEVARWAPMIKAANVKVN